MAASQARSLAPAVADIARSLAGRVRYLYELATGVPAFADGGATPLNPQGRLGIDHSGPPWGVAYQHPLWYVEGLPQIARAVDVYGEAPVLSLATQNQTLRILARFYVRPFQKGPTVPYRRGYLTMTATALGAGTATASVKIYDADTANPEAAFRTSTITVASTSIPANIASEIYTTLEPGYCRRLIEVKLTSTVGMRIDYASINQIVRRTH